MLTLLHVMQDCCSYYERCARRYGDPFTLPSPYGPIVVTGSPNGIRQIFTADPEVFGVWGKSITEPFFGPMSLMMLEGQQHLERRKLLMPPFHARHLHNYGRIVVDAVAAATASWSPGERFVVQKVMHTISYDVMTRIFFKIDEERLQTFKSAFATAQQAMSPAITFLPFMRREMLGLGPWARFRQAVDVLDGVVYDLIDRRRAGPPTDDTLSFLLTVRRQDGSGLSDRELRDNLIFFITAGHETVASGLAWALYWLHREPETLVRLRDEISGRDVVADPQAIMALPYLEAVCHEALRIGPILPEMVRRLNRPLDLLGYTLPAGTGIGVVASLVHMNPDIYPEPHLFRPERFIERKYSPYEFIPFGGGVRRCMGASFALYEMKIALATLLSRYEFRLDGDRPVKPTRPRAIPLGPHDAVRLTVTAQSGNAAPDADDRRRA